MPVLEGMASPAAHRKKTTNPQEKAPRTDPFALSGDTHLHECTGKADGYTAFGARVDGCAPILTWQVPYEVLQVHNEVQSRIEDIIDSIPLEHVAKFLDGAANAYRGGNREQIGRIAGQLARAGFGAPPTPWLRTRLWADLQAYAALEVTIRALLEGRAADTAP